MSALGDRIIADGPFVAGGADPEWIRPPRVAAEWNALRDELIRLREVAAVAEHNGRVFRAAFSGDVPPELLRWQPGEWRGCAPETPGNPLTSPAPCAHSETTDAGECLACGACLTLRACPVCGGPLAPGMVECAGCAGAEDAAAKRQADQ